MFIIHKIYNKVLTYNSLSHSESQYVYSQILIRHTPIFVGQQEIDLENLIASCNLEPFYYGRPMED